MNGNVNASDVLHQVRKYEELVRGQWSIGFFEFYDKISSKFSYVIYGEQSYHNSSSVKHAPDFDAGKKSRLGRSQDPFEVSL